jgi:outer membrane lipoprotein carrier protein
MMLYSRAFCAALALCAVVAANATGTADASGELQGYLSGLKSFEAQFRQTLRDSRARVTQEVSGRLYLQKPGRFRWEYQVPDEQLIVSDGRNLWLYDVELEQVTVKALDASIATTPALLLAGEASVDESFSVTRVPGAEGTSWFELVPKRQDTDFVRVRLAFARGELKAMELEDKLQQRTLLEFSAVKRNPRLRDALFAFSPPAGVDVIGTPKR